MHDALGRLGCPENQFRLIKSFLSERKVMYRTSTAAVEQKYNVGCPKDSNSGPFFWNLVADSLLKLDLGKFLRIIAYADDFGLVVEAPNAYVCGRRVNEALIRIARWA